MEFKLSQLLKLSLLICLIYLTISEVYKGPICTWIRNSTVFQKNRLEPSGMSSHCQMIIKSLTFLMIFLFSQYQISLWSDPNSLFVEVHLSGTNLHAITSSRKVLMEVLPMKTNMKLWWTKLS